MNESIQKTLLALKDVHGTRGSFVLNPDGKLLAMEMPALFDPTMFAELGPRIERLAETFSALGDEMESCVIRFADHLLCVKQFPKGGSLCILTENGVSLPALKMAVNLAHRRLAGEVADAAPMNTGTEPPAAPAAAAPTPLPEAPMAAVPADTEDEEEMPKAKPQRFYRGHPVDD